MGLRNLITGKLPDPAEVEQKTLLEQAATSPLLAPFRIFWSTLNDFRADWPVLIPVLLLVGIGKYRSERKRHLRRLIARVPQVDQERT